MPEDFLKLTLSNSKPIVGGSEDAEHRQWIDVMSFHYAINGAVVGLLDNAIAGVAPYGSFLGITKKIDQCSNALLNLLFSPVDSSGKAMIATGTLAICVAGNTPGKTTLLQFDFTDLAVTGVTPQLGSDNDSLIEYITFAYSKVALTYNSLPGPQGSEKVGPLAWDFAQNTKG